MSELRTTDLPFIKFYTGDYRRMTAALSLAEKGAFMQLLVFFWDTGKPMVDDDKRLARIVGCSVLDWLKIKPALLEAGFEIDDSDIRNRYFEHMRAVASETHQKNIERARKAARARHSKGAA